jgi:archaemetzincin
MNRIALVPVGDFDRRLAQRLCAPLAAGFEAECRLTAGTLDPQSAFHPERQQYHSTELLGAMQPLATAPYWRVLGLAAVDLFIPILTFVFGEAQMGGPCAIVSSHRLHQEFYGLPADPELVFERTVKEAVHELGHTLGLTHCDDYQCAMAPSHSVEWIDLKTSALCDHCRGLISVMRVTAAVGPRT